MPPFSHTVKVAKAWAKINAHTTFLHQLWWFQWEYIKSCQIYKCSMGPAVALKMFRKYEIKWGCFLALRHERSRAKDKTIKKRLKINLDKHHRSAEQYHHFRSRNIVKSSTLQIAALQVNQLADQYKALRFMQIEIAWATSRPCTQEKKHYTAVAVHFRQYCTLFGDIRSNNYLQLKVKLSNLISCARHRVNANASQCVPSDAKCSSQLTNLSDKHL